MPDAGTRAVRNAPGGVAMADGPGAGRALGAAQAAPPGRGAAAELSDQSPLKTAKPRNRRRES